MPCGHKRQRRGCCRGHLQLHQAAVGRGGACAASDRAYWSARLARQGYSYLHGLHMHLFN